MVKCKILKPFFLVFLMGPSLGPSALALTLRDGPQSFDPDYEKCVARLLRHPVHRNLATHQNGPGVFEINSSFLDDTDQVCRCVGRLEVKERERSRDENLSYFFSGRANYFAELDTCLLDKASEKHYKEFNKIFTFDQIIPLVQVELKNWSPPMATMVRGRLPAQEIQLCMVEKVLESCSKIRSLFFTYRCLKEKMKMPKFYEGIQRQCTQGTSLLQDNGPRI
jgi:hypothetical protein